MTRKTRGRPIGPDLLYNQDTRQDNNNNNSNNNSQQEGVACMMQSLCERLGQFNYSDKSQQQWRPNCERRMRHDSSTCRYRAPNDKTSSDLPQPPHQSMGLLSVNKTSRATCLVKPNVMTTTNRTRRRNTLLQCQQAASKPTMRSIIKLSSLMLAVTMLTSLSILGISQQQHQQQQHQPMNIHLPGKSHFRS